MKSLINYSKRLVVVQEVDLLRQILDDHLRILHVRDLCIHQWCFVSSHPVGRTSPKRIHQFVRWWTEKRQETISWQFWTRSSGRAQNDQANHAKLTIWSGTSAWRYGQLHRWCSRRSDCSLASAFSSASSAFPSCCSLSWQPLLRSAFWSFSYPQSASDLRLLFSQNPQSSSCIQGFLAVPAETQTARLSHKALVVRWKLG